MSLLDNLKDKALETVNDSERQKKWAEKGFDAAIAEARKLVPADQSNAELKAVADAAEYGIKKLEKHKAALVGLGANGLRSALTLVGIGQYETAAEHAALLKIRTGGWSDVSAGINNVAGAGNEAKRELDAEIAEIKTVLKDIGTTAAKALLPILIAVL